MVLACQIATVSVFAPYKWCQAQFKLFKAYPASEYPLFYVFSVQQEKLHLFVRVFLDVMVAMIVTWAAFHGLLQLNSLNVFAVWASISGLQVIPSLFSLFLLRLASRKRQHLKPQGLVSFSTEPRSIIDYLPLIHLTLVVISMLLTVNLIASNASLETSKKLALVLLFLSTCALLSFNIFNTLYGKKHDTLMATTDVTEKRKQDVQRNFFGIGIAVLVFTLIGVQGAKVQDAQWLLLPLSLLFQISILYRSTRWHASDMEVYKA